MARVGYIRVSTIEQNIARQEAIMEQLNVERVYIDKVSGKNAERPELLAMIDYVRDGDTVVVESVSRFARNPKDFFKLVDQLESKGVEFESQKEKFDTTTPAGKFALTMFAAIAELENEVRAQRQREGIKAAKDRGVYKGRSPMEFDEKAFEEEYKKWKNGETAPRFMIEKLGMTSATFWRRVKAYREKHGIEESFKKGVRKKDGEQ